jgi:hypothetical protein
MKQLCADAGRTIAGMRGLLIAVARTTGITLVRVMDRPHV